MKTLSGNSYLQIKTRRPVELGQLPSAYYVSLCFPRLRRICKCNAAMFTYFTPHPVMREIIIVFVGRGGRGACTIQARCAPSNFEPSVQPARSLLHPGTELAGEEATSKNDNFSCCYSRIRVLSGPEKSPGGLEHSERWRILSRLQYPY